MHYEDPVFELALDGAGGMTDPEIAVFLNSLSTLDVPLIAAAEIHTGAMIALVPSDDDIGRLTIDGGEEPTQLHLTLAYLGDAADIPEEMQDRITAAMDAIAAVFDPIIANGFSVNLFNPGTEDACVVIGVSGSDSLIDLHASVQSALRGISNTFPENHKPWIPHITLAYMQSPETVAEAIERTGPVTLDRIRVAFAGEEFDYPLGGDVLTAAAGTGPKNIRWGTDGSMNRCLRIMRGKVKDPGGLCATWHKNATGEWPAEEGVPSSVEITTASTLEPGATSAPWEGVLTVEGVESGDGREFALGSLDWAALPLPMMYQRQTSDGHMGSYQIGNIDHIARKGNQLYGWGTLDLLSEHGPEAYRLMKEKRLRGNSVDVDSVKDADVEFVYAPIPEPMEGVAELADVVAAMGKPIKEIYHRGRIRGTTLVSFPAFTEAELKISETEVVTASAEEDCGCEAPLTAASHTITLPDVPPAHWFNEPTDAMHGALTITDEGRIFGILAPSGVTHRSVKAQVPMGNVDYTRWMKSEIPVAGGGRVVAGVITGNCGHAATENYGTLANRKKHYDDSCSVFAYAKIGENREKGYVWVAGGLRPGISPDQVSQFFGCSLSGDWQPHPDRPGVREFIAALAVPVPGFAMARKQASVKTEDGVLVSSTIPIEFRNTTQRDRMLSLQREMLMLRMGRTPEMRRDALVVKMHGGA